MNHLLLTTVGSLLRAMYGFVAVKKNATAPIEQYLAAVMHEQPLQT